MGIGRTRVVITAAHCLPKLPVALAGGDTQELTYRELLGPLGEARPTVWAECWFVDAIADLAVLGSPDNQVFFDESDAYDVLVDRARPLPIGAAKKGRAWVLGLDGRWFRYDLEKPRSPLWSTSPAEPITGGMSGSPIVQGGRAVGVVSTTSDTRGADGTHRSEHAAGPCLIDDLPGRLVRP